MSAPTVPTLLVIGGDAAGMSAAAGVKRAMGDDIHVTVFERGEWTSYSACGIPYWMAGSVDGPDALVARSPLEHCNRGIDVHTRTEAVVIRTAEQVVQVRAADGTLADHHYDELLIATGAEPIRPDLPGIDAEGIYGVQTLEDGCRLVDALKAKPARVVVVGSGYIGLEMAEACVVRGVTTTVIDQAPSPLPFLDGELGARVHVAMSGLGIGVQMATPVRGFDVDRDGAVCAVLTDRGRVEADLVILGLGVRARSDLARDAGLRLGVSAGVEVDAHQRVVGQERIWAAGDCALSRHRISGATVHMPLGTHANKQGATAGRNIVAARRGGEPVEFAGVLGTAITKICELEIAVTGLTLDAAGEAGLDAVRASVDTTTSAGYLPQAHEMTVTMVAERGTRRILGSQIVGGPGSAIRIDTVATALWSGMTVDQLIQCDLAYAPPFSSVWDPVQVAAKAVSRELG
ncbi:MAG: FAD-dependent oxidoreductase [Jatrophihabitans sp.]